ncbi:MAG TPA: DUF3616 domain-containing protein [Allosphingosinicella sp.]|jgi:hypothetical protein|nr:DUF3616 domain-containing protein [Allosphingosinicella sp.]
MTSRRVFCGLAAAAIFPVLLAGALPPPVHYSGVCEASAAAALDSNRFVVASDELELLTLYKRGAAQPLSTFAHPDVTDIEGAARIGDTIFWVTSHSVNKEKEDKPKRKILFATKVLPTGALAAAGTDYRNLRADIAALLGVQEKIQQNGKVTGGLALDLNIEGLAAAPDGSLFVGLRGPLSSGKAQVVRIVKPFGRVGLPQAAPVGPAQPKVFRLNLEGRGIRSLERVGKGSRAFLIVAGPVGDSGPAPKLYWWDGRNQPTPGPGLGFGAMKPEALIAVSAGRVQILGDNDDNCAEDEAAPPRRFPSRDVYF